MGIKSINGLSWLRKQIETADKDLLREMVKVFAEALMGTEADSLCGAGYGQVSLKRINRRNGYRQRRWDSRAGTMTLVIPKLRKGCYLPEWLLCPRRRSEHSLARMVTACYVRRVSTRKVDGLVHAMGLEGIFRSRACPGA